MMTSSRTVRPFFGLLLGVVLVTIGTADTHAQSGMRSVGAVGTGGGASALADGPAAMYTSPANLTVGPVRHNVEIQLLQFGAYTGGDAYQFDHYETLFVEERSSPLRDERERAILNDWFGDAQRKVSTYLELTPLAVTYRPDKGQWALGFGIRGRSIQTTGTNKGLFDLLLRGTNPSRNIPINGQGRAYSTVNMKAAFSYRVSSVPLSVGISPSAIFGLGYSGGEVRSTATVSGDSLVHRFDYTAQAAGAPSTGLFEKFNAFGGNPISGDELMGASSGVSGVGGGVDLGATYTIQPGLHASLSITDLGWVRWMKDAQTVTPENNVFRFDGVDGEDFNGDIGDHIEAELDSLSKNAYQNVERDRSSFTTGLPTTLHLGSTWDQGLVVVNGGLAIGLNNDAGATPDPVAVHVGSTLNAGPVPLRFGVRGLGQQALTFSGGTGLDVGTYSIELGASVTPNTTTLGGGARYAVSLSLGTIRI